MTNKSFAPLILVLFLPGLLVAQETIVQGKVTDANSGDAVPFVNVVFKGTSIGGHNGFRWKFSYQDNYAGRFRKGELHRLQAESQIR